MAFSVVWIEWIIIFRWFDNTIPDSNNIVSRIELHTRSDIQGCEYDRYINICFVSSNSLMVKLFVYGIKHLKQIN